MNFHMERNDSKSGTKQTEAGSTTNKRLGDGEASREIDLRNGGRTVSHIQALFTPSHDLNIGHYWSSCVGSLLFS